MDHLPFNPLPFDGIDFTHPQLSQVGLPMLPEFVAAQRPIGHVNEFATNQGLMSFIYHAPAKESDGRIIRPTIGSLLRGAKLKMTEGFNVTHYAEDDGAPEFNRSIAELLGIYQAVLNGSERHIQAGLIDGPPPSPGDTAFLACPMGLGMRVVRHHGEDAVQPYQIYPNSEFCQESSAVRANKRSASRYVGLHFAKQRERLMLFHALITHRRYVSEGTSFQPSEAFTAVRYY